MEWGEVCRPAIILHGLLAACAGWGCLATVETSPPRYNSAVRRQLRILRRVVTALLTLLCFLTAAMWVESYRNSDAVCWRFVHRSRLAILNSNSGQFSFGLLGPITSEDVYLSGDQLDWQSNHDPVRPTEQDDLMLDQLLSGPLALMVPVLVFWQYQNLLVIIANLLSALDSFVAHISFDPSKTNGISISQGVNGNIMVETVMIVCLTLVVMTWAQRSLEYVVFKLKL